MNARLLLVALCAAAACADNKSSVEILGRAAPDSIPSCKFTAGGTFLSGPGQLDVGPATRTYDAMLYLTNTMTDPTKMGTSTVSSSKAWRATAAKIRINPSDYLSKFPPAPNLLAASGEARLPLDGQTINVGTSSVQYVSIIDTAMGNTLATALGAGTSATVVVGVTLEGVTLDGASLDTGEWYFPVDVCQGAGCGYPTCKAGDVIAGCFGPYQDPIACVTP